MGACKSPFGAIKNGETEFPNKYECCDKKAKTPRKLLSQDVQGYLSYTCDCTCFCNYMCVCARTCVQMYLCANVCSGVDVYIVYVHV